tara:strand:- start:58 stop:531 length:474 start_codon:yes stop_codon:yes gene_type:complete
MKNILYYLIPIVSILFLVSCDEDDDKASESFMLKHDKTKWKYVGTDGTTSFIYIDMDKIKDYYNDPSEGVNDCCTWSTATGSHTDCDGISYTNTMRINKGDTLSATFNYTSAPTIDVVFIVSPDGTELAAAITDAEGATAHMYTKTTEALPSVTCVP